MALARRFKVLSGADPLRVAVVGTGAMGLCWARAVLGHPDLELVGLADVDKRRAQGAAIRLRRTDLPIADSIDGLAATRADVCINVTPPSEHYQVIARALGQGLAVLTEKPFAESLAQAAALTSQAQAAGSLLMVSQSRSYEPGLAALRDLAGDLGPLTSVKTELSLAYQIDGFRRDLAQPLLLDMAVHSFDAIRLVTAREPVSVYCEAFNPPWSWFSGPAAAMVIVELTDGVRYLYDGNWCATGSATSWNGRWHVTGELGTACWDGVHPPSRDPQVSESKVSDRAADPVAQVMAPLDDFVRALRTGAIPWGECSGNLRTMAIIEAAIRSAASRRPIGIDELVAQAQQEVAPCA